MRPDLQPKMFPGEDWRDDWATSGGFLIKEHTEYSPNEWALITAEGEECPKSPELRPEDPPAPASDDFHNAGQIEENT